MSRRGASFWDRFRRKEVVRSLSHPGPKTGDFEEVKSLWDTRASAGAKLGEVLAKLPTIEEPVVYLESLVREAERHLVQPTPENLKWCFDNEESIQKITKLMSETIAGAGWEIEGVNSAKAEIEDLYENEFPMTDFLETSTINLVQWGNSLWVPRFEEEGFLGIDSLDWRDIKVYKHPLSGWLMFVQEVMLPSGIIRSRGEEVMPITEREWRSLPPETMSASMAETQRHYFKLFPEDTVFLKTGSRGFPIGRSPMEPVLTEIVYKKLLEWYMCRSFEIWGSPILVGKTGAGIPAERLVSMMRQPEDWASYQKRISDFADLLVKYRQFGVFSLAADQELEVRFPGRGFIPYVEAFDYFNREIMGCILGSTALFEARGVELATSKTIRSVWDQAVDGWRRRIEDGLNRQFHPLYLRRTGTEGSAKIEFKRWEIPEELVARLLEIPREERRKARRLTDEE